MTNWKIVRIEQTKWDLYVKIVTFGFVDLWGLRLVAYGEGYDRGRKDAENTWSGRRIK